MAGSVNQYGFFLRVIAPQDKHYRLSLGANSLDDGIGESFPAAFLMAACLACFYRQYGVEQLHALRCPRLQAASVTVVNAEVILQFAVNIEQ